MSVYNWFVVKINYYSKDAIVLVKKWDTWSIIVYVSYSVSLMTIQDT
jgi:hypothetical protein